MGLNRRDALRVVGGVSIAGMAGCSMLGGDSDNGGGNGTLFSESFEADGMPETMSNDSQQNASVSITSDLASDGSQSIGMASTPGTSTSAKVTTVQSFSGPRTYAVDLYKVADDVSEGGCRLIIRDESSEAELSLFDIDYYGGVCYEEKDENGDRIAQSTIAGPLPSETWHELSLTVREGGLAFRVGGEKSTYEPAQPWADRDVNIQLSANTWGGAFATGLDVRYDDLRVTEL